MEKTETKERMFKQIAIVISSVLLTFLLIWFGYSFFSMRSEQPYVNILIDFEDNTLVDKVKVEYPKRDGKYLEYSFPIVLEQFSETEEEYIITGIPYNYKSYYDIRDQARFEYPLDSSKGKFDFLQLEWNDPLVITLKYRMDLDFKYFFNFSRCTFSKAVSNLFSIGDSSSRGNCIIKKDITSWEINKVNVDIADKKEFFDSYDRDSLVRGLFNFFITDDLGYFNPNQYKVVSTQRNNEDGTYEIFSDIVKNKEESKDPVLFMLLRTTSEMYNKDYEEYEDINVELYMETLASYWNQKIPLLNLSCEMSFDIISNLENCTSQACTTVKDTAYQNCKLLVQEKEKDCVDNETTPELISEMVYYNRVRHLIGEVNEGYSESVIASYLTKARTFNQNNSNVVDKCYLLKGANEMYSEYRKNSYKEIQNSLLTELPDFNSLCNTIIKDRYCLSSITEKLVCADALLPLDSNKAKEILYNIFYEHYFESPVSNKMNAFENIREATKVKKSNTGIKLNERGYFVQRGEVETNGSVDITLSSWSSFSHYYIYILSKIENE